MGSAASAPITASSSHNAMATQQQMEELQRQIEKLNRRVVELEAENKSLRQAAGVTGKSKSGLGVGTHVMAMWSPNIWQYFPAKIAQIDIEKMEYVVDWDDKDTRGKEVAMENVAIDKTPDENEVGIGSIVLFSQGGYGTSDGTSGGIRWHQGVITEIDDSGSETVYSGHHTKGEADGKSVTYSRYNYSFSGLRLDQLRIAPNMLDVIGEALEDADDMGSAVDACDIYVSYAPVNSKTHGKHSANTAIDPRDIGSLLAEKVGVSVTQIRPKDQIKRVQQIAGAKLMVACISDEYAKDAACREEFQYAKKSLGLTVIPVVVGDSFSWVTSIVGMLIAGELYIHFKDQTIWDAKVAELLNAVNASLKRKSKAAVKDTTDSAAKPAGAKCQVFISYCWSNSKRALDSKQISALTGSEFSDPRVIKDKLKAAGYTVWLDIEQLATSGQDEESASMFEQIAKGLTDVSVVITFVSEDYAKSNNCRMEFQFAVKSLQKNFVPVIVGSGDVWKSSVVGMLVADKDPIDLQRVNSTDQFNQKFNEIVERISGYTKPGQLAPLLGGLASKWKSVGATLKNITKSKAPVPGDHVISHHKKWAYYTATIDSFDRENMMYVVNWDDGDTTGRETAYNLVAHNKDASADEVGVGTKVFFPQGSYGASDQSFNKTGGKRYHEGIITSITTNANGEKLYYGNHTKGEEDGKWVTYRGYEYTFSDLPLNVLRVAPNAMDALFANY